MAIRRDRAIALSVINEMLQYTDKDGIIQVTTTSSWVCFPSFDPLFVPQTYFDHRRPRFDPVVCVNVLNLFYTYGRGSDLSRTLHWVYEVLYNRAYLDGTRYYESAECFLYFLSRLLTSSDNPELQSLLRPLLKERVQERIGAEADALSLAMRILVCDFVGLRNEVDLRTLLPLQCEDGGWEIGWIYKYGQSGLKIGNRGLTTALAIKAIKLMSKLPEMSESKPFSPSTKLYSSLPTKLPPSKSSPISPKSRHRSPLKISLQWLWNGIMRNSKSVQVDPI